MTLLRSCCLASVVWIATAVVPLSAASAADGADCGPAASGELKPFIQTDECDVFFLNPKIKRYYPADGSGWVIPAVWYTGKDAGLANGYEFTAGFFISTNAAHSCTGREVTYTETDGDTWGPVAIDPPPLKSVKIAGSGMLSGNTADGTGSAQLSCSYCSSYADCDCQCTSSSFSIKKI